MAAEDVSMFAVALVATLSQLASADVACWVIPAEGLAIGIDADVAIGVGTSHIPVSVPLPAPAESWHAAVVVASFSSLIRLLAGCKEDVSSDLPLAIVESTVSLGGDFC